MDVIELLGELEDLIDKGFELPVIHKTFINKEDVLEIIGDISLQLPEELRMARNVAADRERILADAHKQAEQIIKGAEEKIVALIDEHEITRQATARANEIVAKAQANSREIRVGTMRFADDILQRTQNDLKAVNDAFRANVAKLTDTLESSRAELQK